MDSAIADQECQQRRQRQASVSGSLAALDNTYVSVQAARGLAGDYLNQADVIDTNQQSKAVQLESDRSRAEDLDMLQGISDFQNQTTGYQAALKSYAIQSMSLFDFGKQHHAWSNPSWAASPWATPLWGRSRELAGVQLRVAAEPAMPVDAPHLLRTLDELWSADAPPLLLRNPQLLVDLLAHGDARAPDRDPRRLAGQPCPLRQQSARTGAACA
jgi:hypothetical protein